MNESQFQTATQWVEEKIKLLGESAGDLILMTLAMGSGRMDVMDLLLAKGFDINMKDANGDMPIHLAASCGYTEAVKWLLKNGADINAKGKNDRTPIVQAAANGKVEVIMCLKEFGACG
jgi:ankyrin repeat protein